MKTVYPLFNNVSVGVRETWWFGAFRLLFSSNNGTKGLAAARQKQLELFYFSAAPSHSHFANEQNNGNCGKICRPIMNHDGCDMWQK